MTLYRADKIENAKSIVDNGFCGNDCKFATGIHEFGLYGFTNEKSADDFAYDQCWDNGYIVSTFDIDDERAILDPEYDGESFFVAMSCDENIKAVVIRTVEK